MTYRLHIGRRAQSYLDRLDRTTQGRTLDRLQVIAENPYGPFTKPLVNAGGRRSSRVGDLRIVFAIDESAALIDVTVIGPRGRSYRNM